MAYSNRDEIDLTAPVVREFRVKCVRRYIVTEWQDYRGRVPGIDGCTVRQIGEFENATQATEVAKMFGLANPGSLVNGMDEHEERSYGLPVSETPAEPSEAQIKHMVDRFLAWRLPDPWRPDGGISFTPSINQATGKPYESTPTGTNLFDATQAEAMVRHMIEGMAEAA